MMPMRTISVPLSLQTRSPNVRSRTHGVNAEEIFRDFVENHAGDIESTLVYLPVSWWMNTVKHQTKTTVLYFGAVPEVQAFLDSLDPLVHYATVSRGDDGPYERLPPNTLVFGAGGVGNIPIPLLPPLCHDNR